ncbi:MAG TPA: phosphoribosylformylglycinamidine synthase subunit PurS [Methylomirabilota bacterium]|jgi:phosphoribosylformylglycinamidine synthase|nr:phosphoribosylformylglycinamidine synthase subunit PurS [Methylomirabilota bacterium]
MKARVLVRFRPGVLDPQGLTIQKALRGKGFVEVQDLRVGKVFEFTLDETDPARARTRLDDMCRVLLANPVIEEYACEVVEDARERPPAG